MLKKKAPKPNALNDPLKPLYDTAMRLAESLDNFEDYFTNELISKVLVEILSCHIRFLTGIYVSIFLMKDYKDEDVDRMVLNYIEDDNNEAPNELLGLCEELCSFLKLDGLEKMFSPKLFRLSFDKLRIKSPPLSFSEGDYTSDRYFQYGHHIVDVMKTFRKETDFINKGSIYFNWEYQLQDNQREFKAAAIKLIKEKKIISNARVKGNHESGTCQLRLENGEPIQLDPIIIPLSDLSRNFRLASLVKFSGYQENNQSPILYSELTGDGVEFDTENEILFKKLYIKKGLVSEFPSFYHKINLLDGQIALSLYKGDIFDLNFIAGIEKTAMVNILYADLKYDTVLSKRLKNLSGSSVFEELKIHAPLQKKEIYSTGAGDLKFSKIFHCPIYNVKEDKDPHLNVIKNSVHNIIKACIEQNIQCLIVPAMGSFWAGQTRYKVASTWCDGILNNPSLKDSSLIRIIFSFVNPETCEVYRKCIDKKTEDRFSNCHLPVSRMHSDIATSRDHKDRLDGAINLSKFLYSFVVAWCIRSLMWEKFKKEQNDETYNLNEDQVKFIKELCSRAGLSEALTFREKLSGKIKARIKDKIPERTQERFERFLKTKWLNIGDWRELARLGYKAIENHEWSFNKWYAAADKKSKKVFKAFFDPGGEFDFPKLRNEEAHSNSFKRGELDIKRKADHALSDIREVIENMPFLRQKKNEMVLLEKVDVNEDTGKCTLIYRDLSGKHIIPPRKQKHISMKDMGGRVYETNRVYLIEGVADNTIRAMNMHPFLLYGECPGCARQRYFIWQDFKEEKDGSLRIQYISTTCSCVIDAHEEIAGINPESLGKRFTRILEKLSSNDGGVDS